MEFDQKDIDPALRRTILSVENVIETATRWLTAKWAYKQLLKIAEGLYDDDPVRNADEIAELLEIEFNMKHGSLPRMPRKRRRRRRRR